MSWQVVFTVQAQKDAEKMTRAGLKGKTEKLYQILKVNPCRPPPSYEKLIGDLSGAYSRRINIQLKLVYQILEQ